MKNQIVYNVIIAVMVIVICALIIVVRNTDGILILGQKVLLIQKHKNRIEGLHHMKRILIVKPNKLMSTNDLDFLREYISEQFENNKPIVLNDDVTYDVVELSEGPIVINI